MSDVKALQQERISIFHDVSDNKIPKRVPINVGVGLDALASFGGIDAFEVHWDYAKLEAPLERLSQTICTDVPPLLTSSRIASIYQILDSQSFMMSSTGNIQHPEVVGMLPDEYDYLIEKPYECILEKVMPRQFKALDNGDPITMMLSFAKSVLSYNADFGQMIGLVGRVAEKCGLYPGAPAGSGGFTEAPFDFIADQLRGFKEISMDVRRMPEKIAEACEAVYPIMLKRGMPKVVSNYGSVFLPLHMPTFMREKDFANLWWPSFKRLIEEYASMGIHCRLFCEDNWERYLDYLYELPTDTILWFEYGNPKLIKEKLGKKFIITGLFPLTAMKTRTKDECVALVKEYLDILAPGGKYIFGFDKSPLVIQDINMENLIAITQTVREYGIYNNVGATAGMSFNRDDYKASPSRPLQSKYYKTWEQYKSLHPKVSEFAKTKLQDNEEALFQYLIYLLI